MGRQCPPLYIKRDDCTGLAQGGNKTRKLMYLLADAKTKGATRIVTRGAMQSNHVRQTAAACALLGLKFDAVLTRAVPISSTDYLVNGNVVLNTLMGATTHIANHAQEADALVQSLHDHAKNNGDMLYDIPTGGSCATGALGYVAAIEEIAEQWSTLHGGQAIILHASASGGTQAGLIAGVSLTRAPFEIHGVNVYKQDMSAVQQNVLSLAEETLSLMGQASTLSKADVTLHDGALGEGYGMVTQAGIRAVKKLASLEGILLDPVYTGKAMGALLARIEAGDTDPAVPIIFLHTGGSTSLHAYREYLTY